MEQEKLWVSIKTTSFNKHLTICLSTACETNENIWNYIKLLNIKGILSTKIVIFSYPKLFSFSILTFIEWKINTELCCKRYDFLTKNTQNYLSLSELLSWMTIFKSIHMAFYVSPSWACTLFRNNKQHVVLGQKRNCQRVQESGLWRIQRERWIEVKYLPNGTNAGYM